MESYRVGQVGVEKELGQTTERHEQHRNEVEAMRERGGPQRG